MRGNRPRCAFLCGLIVLLVAGACAGSREAGLIPDEQFGHRYEDEGPAGRNTLQITSPEPDEEYFEYIAVIDTVHVRPASFSSELARNGRVPVEVLIKGSLPDTCTELHEVRQERFGHIIHMRLETRRPQGALCRRVIRPFRFYAQLEGLFGPGSYTLKLNRVVYNFTIRPEEVG